MATPGISLFGFLDEAAALIHLKQATVQADTSDAALLAIWRAARGKIGPPVPRAGMPDIQPLPTSAAAHLAALQAQPWVQAAFQAVLNGATFKLVEIDTLLAFQLNVDCARSDHHLNGSSPVPALSELLNICLPLTNAAENVSIFPGPGSALITSRGMNFGAMHTGLLQDHAGRVMTDAAGNSFVGVAMGVRLPLVHVVRLNGRCYLHNGFHRAIGARKRGATHVPCVFREVPDAASAGIAPPGTFDLSLLESANPPTLAHYAQSRAEDVTLRTFNRQIHVSWAEYITPQD